jgi:type IX secretion system PorP/SprF family membrane protein
MRLIRTIFIYAGILASCSIEAQDPHFSQFFMAPQFINPALVGIGTGDWKIMGNVRQQWGNAGTPFNTQALAAEVKITGREEDENTLAVGVSVMNDQSMNGAFKSIYGSGIVAYNLRLAPSHRLGAGLSAAYGNRIIDYSQLTFGEQFTSGGFNLSLPTGETSLTNMKPFVSVGAGLLYSYTTEYLNIDAGIAADNVNRPPQTFLNDPRKYLEPRYTFHCNMEYSASDRMIYNLNTIFQRQNLQSYFSLGGSAGFDLTDGFRDRIFYLGIWYRESDALYPYVGFQTGSFQIGLSYDVTISSQNKGPYNPRSFELSFVLRNARKVPGVIPCPWK